MIGAEGLGPRPSGDLLIIDTHGRTGGALLAGAVQPESIADRSGRTGAPLAHTTGRISG